MRELWATRRRLVFTYDLLVLGLLLLVGILYLEFRDYVFEHQIFRHSASSAQLIPEKYRVFANCMWLGAIGGVVISLKGVYDNACEPPWSNCYNLWHLGRPFSGAVTGVMAVFIFLFLTQNAGFSRPAVYLAAFILGTQEARFFTFLFEIGRIIVQVPPSLKEATGLRVTAIEPAEGGENTVVVLAGQGFERGVNVKVGGVQLTNQVAAPDGTSVAGAIPRLEGQTRLVDVTVLNPSGSSAILPNKFKFIA